MELQNFISFTLSTVYKLFFQQAVLKTTPHNILEYMQTFSSEPNAIARIRGPQSLNEEQETSAFSNLFYLPSNW